MRNSMYRKLMARTLVVLMGCAVSFGVAAEDEQPSATVTISELQVMVLVGGDHGHGTLSFNGAEHDFTVAGVKLGGIGIHKKDMKGSVYRLNNLDDFNGIYFLVEAGLTLAKGRGGLWMKNGNGVIMHLKSSTEGLALSVGVEGLKVSLDV